MKRFILLFTIAFCYVALSNAQRLSKAETYELQPLIPITEATASELADLEIVRQRMIDWFKSGSAPSIDAAKTKIESLRTSNNASPLNVASEMKALGQHWQHTKDSATLELAKELLGFVTVKYKTGYDEPEPNKLKRGYDSKTFYEGVTLVIGDIEDNKIREDFIGFMKYFYYYNMCWSESWEENQELNSDFVHNTLRGLLGVIALGTVDNNKAVREMKGFKRLLDIANRPGPGALNWIKHDGTGFHHSSHYNEYMYAYGSYINILSKLKSTQYSIGKEGYELFRDAAYAILIMCNENIDYAMSLCGRKTFNANSPISQSSLKSLAYIGGEVYGTLADSVLAVEYNRMYGDDPALMAAYGKADFPTGLWQFNWSPIAVYRGNEWVATAHGMNAYFFGSEIINNDGIYARYQAYGALEVMYKGDLSKSGFSKTSWDYSLFPGTTTKYLAKADIDPGNESDERADPSSRFAGGLRFKELNPGNTSLLDAGEVGIYGNDFQQYEGLSSKHDGSFKFKKSYFFMDDYIVCLGSNIQCADNANKIVTTLYQGVLTNSSDPIVINGSQNTSDKTESLSTSNQRIVDAFKTGYHLVSGTGSLEINRSGSKTSAYMNHGIAPDNAAYEYVVVPSTTEEDMAIFSQRMQSDGKPYAVLAQNEDLHAVKFKNKTEAYSLFKINTDIQGGYVKANTKPCLVMMKPNGEQLALTLVNPDLGLSYQQTSNPAPVTLEITIRGKWESMVLDNDISIVSTTDTTTTLSFTTEKGEPYDALLKQAGTSGNPVQVSGIKLSIDSDTTIKINQEIILSATVEPEDAENNGFSWYSGNDEVAVVTNGLVRGISEDETYIYVKTDENGFKDSVKVIVSGFLDIPVTKIALSDDNLLLEEGVTDTLLFFITPENASDKTVQWLSDDISVAEVVDGIVNAKAEGTTTITVTTNSGNYTASCNVRVFPVGDVMFCESLNNMIKDGWGAAETYIGDNGFEWTVSGKGTSGNIGDSKDTYFNNKNSYGVLSGTITGGISSFTVKCKDINFGGNERVLELSINDEVISTKSHTGTEIYDFNVNDINIPGDFVLKINNISPGSDANHIAIDDICWTPYEGSVSIEKNNLSQFKYYPNPFSSSFTISIEKGNYSKVKIYNSIGRLINSININGQKNITISPSYSIAPKGIYLLQFIGDEYINTVKILRK